MEGFNNTLLVFIDAAQYRADAEVRGLVNFCKSMQAHYRGAGLTVKLADAKGTADGNFIYDAALGELGFIKDARALVDRYEAEHTPLLVLLSDTGEAVWRCAGIPRAYTLAFAVESLLGEPDYRAHRFDKNVELKLPYFTHTPEEGPALPCECGGQAADGVYCIQTQEEYDAIKTKTFKPGDVIKLARGKVFYGMFAPLGAGTADKPITVTSCGEGPRPVINAWRDAGGIVLYNTSGWVIDGINITGGRIWGIFVGSDRDDGHVYSGFTVRNCSVYEVGQEWPSRKDDAYSGPICFNVYDARTTHTATVHWDNVLIENCEAYNTTRGEGIFVCSAYGTKKRGENIIVQNCFVHDVGHDGILVMCSKNVLIKDNVAFHTGKSPVNVGYSPNSIWTWRCTDALVTGNDASFAHSPMHGTDGGAFDIDFYCKNNTYEYNYAHDNDTYGISVFGAGYYEGMPEPDEHITSNTVIRHNYFGNNQVVGWGEVYFLTWNGGKIDGFDFHDNFIYSNPADGKQPAITSPNVDYAGTGRRVFRDNIIYSSSGFFINIKNTRAVEFEGNRYYSDAAKLRWRWITNDHRTFEQYKGKTKRDKNGTFTQGKPEKAQTKGFVHVR
ncbi:MAG: right-handed parallel beta-helix repeat-containing protein [Defluviitaleaceae bacterium]|nr:right-handed parallel beta-helix repeat-containing protein [Defluviitaleaceae bacterium]